jgi:hypothetical protein
MKLLIFEDNESLRKSLGVPKNLDFGRGAALRPPGRPSSVHRITPDTLHFGMSPRSGERLAPVSKPIFSKRCPWWIICGRKGLRLTRRRMGRTVACFWKSRTTGIGIPAYKQPYIFQRFYRADPSRTKDSRSLAKMPVGTDRGCGRSESRCSAEVA